MQGNLFIFTGENDFAIRNEKLRWIAEFSKKYGADNVIRREGNTMNLAQILDEAAMGPFIAPKRLVVIDILPKLQKGDLETIANAIHPDTVLVFVHRKGTGRRNLLPKDIPDSCVVKSFAVLKSRELQQWADDCARQHGASLPAEAHTALFEIVGEDQEALSGEIAKLASAAIDGVITVDAVRALAVPSAEGVIWKITDDVCAGRRTQALLYAHRLQERGADAFGLWAVLLSMLKNLVVVTAAVHDGRGQDIPKAFGIHPFAARSLLSAAKRIDVQKLAAFVDRVTEEDIALKTGGYRATDEAPQELQALVDRFILTCP